MNAARHSCHNSRRNYSWKFGAGARHVWTGHERRDIVHWHWSLWSAFDCATIDFRKRLFVGQVETVI